MSFDRLGLSPDLLRAVAHQGYTEPTPVQAEAIPLVLDGRDVLAAAQTGTGKTAAFVLPILQRLVETAAYAQTSGRRPVRVLVLTPTRELCLQVEESVRTYSKTRPVRSTTVYGGVPFDPQLRKLLQAPEIVVATPGRLLDHVGQRTIDLSRVEVLVLDEADRMLDMGFIPDVRRIIDLLPRQRQTLLFSATFSDQVRRLAADFQHQPALVQVTPKNTAPDLVRQLVMPVERNRKRELLSRLIRSGRIEQALVFSRTKHGAARLAQQLERDGIAATAIHGDKSQPQRVRALEDFKAGKVDILVATDVAARGLDIDALPHVVNYEMPSVAEDYLHRIGRTGRAGTGGDAISLVSTEEAPLLAQIERLIGRRIETESIDGYATAEHDVARRPAVQPSRDRRAIPAQSRPARASRNRRPAASRSASRRPATGPSGHPTVDRVERAERAERAERIGQPEPARRAHQPARTIVAMPGERFARESA
ncbi:ATP-dependent RNA helicase RhlE [soil metagenome]